MAYVDPWTPQAPVEGFVPDRQVASQIGTFMEDPRARAALLSFGIAMMQPPSFADNFSSQFGRALGAAGEGVRGVTEQQRKDELLAIQGQEAESKQDLRASQADAAVARAGAAEARAGTATMQSQVAAGNLAARQAELEGKNERNALMSRIRLSALYQKYVQDVNERNDPLGKPKGWKAEPVLTIDQWYKANPMLRDSGLLPPSFSGSEPQPASSGGGPDMDVPAPRTPSTPPRPSVESQTNLNPPAPRDPSQRKVGQVYAAPDGRNIQWTGKGWQVVP